MTALLLAYVGIQCLLHAGLIRSLRQRGVILRRMNDRRVFAVAMDGQRWAEN
jgi:hypothetical protein